MTLRDRRNLTPDQLALVMGRHYNRTKLPVGGDKRAQKASLQNVDEAGRTCDRLAKAYGVADLTIQRAGKFAAAVATLKAVEAGLV